MRERIRRFIIMLIIPMVILSGCGKGEASSEGNEEREQIVASAENLVITNLDVGKGDAAFVSFNGMLGLIDTGPKDSFIVLEEYLRENDKRKIDFMVISHFDKDHVGNAVKILEEYEVEKVYLPDYVSSKGGYEKLMEALAGRDDVVYVSEKMKVSFDGLDIEMIPPSDPGELISDKDNMDNDMSLLCRITFGEKSFLFAGDMEKGRIGQILKSEEDLSSDWLKVPHHGGYEDNSREFFAKVAPKYCVISTGDERPADNTVLAILYGVKADTFNTMEGSVVTVCDGENIEMNYLR